MATRKCLRVFVYLDNGAEDDIGECIVQYPLTNREWWYLMSALGRELSDRIEALRMWPMQLPSVLIECTDGSCDDKGGGLRSPWMERLNAPDDLLPPLLSFQKTNAAEGTVFDG